MLKRILNGIIRNENVLKPVNQTKEFRLIHISCCLSLSKNGLMAKNQDNKTQKDLIVSNKPVYNKKESRNRNESRIKIANVNQGTKTRSFKMSFNKNEDYEKKFIFKGKSNMVAENMENENPEELLKSEEDLDLYSMNENLYFKKFADEDLKKRKRIKFGIIRKKINQIEGRVKVNFNLLTWDAKEQIKHLHLKDPHIWTAEKISKSFPITIESCKKLLRSSWAPKTLDELVRHDEKVINNWKTLADIEKGADPGGPAINIYEEYKKMNKLNLLKHATGLPGIDFEKKSLIYNDSYAVHQSLLCKPGSFSKIIKFQDNTVKEYFNRKDDQLENEKLVKRVEDSNLLKDHLLKTKNELSKSLAKIFSTENKFKPE